MKKAVLLLFLLGSFFASAQAIIVDGNVVAGNTDNQAAADVPLVSTPTNYTPSSNDVAGHFAGVDAALGLGGGGGLPNGVTYTPTYNHFNLWDQANTNAVGISFSDAEDTDDTVDNGIAYQSPASGTERLILTGVGVNLEFLTGAIGVNAPFSVPAQTWNSGTFNGSNLAATQDALADAIASIPGGTDNQTALEVPYTPTGTYPTYALGTNLSETNTDAALKELHEEKLDDASLSSGSLNLIARGTARKTLNFRNLTLDGTNFNGNLVGLTTLQELADAFDDFSGAADQTLALSGTGNKDLTISGSGNTVDLTGVDGIDPDNVESKGTGRTNVTKVTEIYEQNQADFDTDGNPGAGILVVIPDAAPAETTTGTALDMGGYSQTDDSAVDTATFTLTDVRAGGYHEVRIDTATEPTITGATQMPGTTAFAANTDMLICIKAFGSTVKYFFVEL